MQAADDLKKPRSFRMSLELANVSVEKGEVKYLFVNLGSGEYFRVGKFTFLQPHPPPPRSIGIIALGENHPKIIELESRRGKIFYPKKLRRIGLSNEQGT